MAANVQFAVYSPPTAGLPYLAVMIDPDGSVSAAAYPTLVEAEAHNNVRAQQLAARLGNASRP